ncbi:MAG: STAS domain-containing protein [Planctomycetota bacterium]
MEDTAKFMINEIPQRNICILRASGELNVEDRKKFSMNADKLLRTEQEKLVIDLTRVNKIFSLYIGSIVDISRRAEEKKKSFSVMAQGTVLRILQEAGITEIVSVIDAGTRQLAAVKT